MRFLGFEIDFGRECEDCRRLRIENTSLRLQLQTMGEHHVELLDEIHRLKNDELSSVLRCATKNILSHFSTCKAGDEAGSKSDPEEVRR